MKKILGKSDEFGTPQYLFDALNKEFGPFEVDLAASTENHKCDFYLTQATDALSINWAGYRRCFLNPPYSKQNGPLKRWVYKAYESAQEGSLVCCVLPADTSSAWFHDYCARYAECRFLRGRVQFEGGATGARFGTLIAIFKPDRRYEYYGA